MLGESLSFLMSEHMMRLGVMKMAMSFEFISGGMMHPSKRVPYWTKLEEKKEVTFCGSPSFYANCEVFKVKPSSSELGRDQKQ